MSPFIPTSIGRAAEADYLKKFFANEDENLFMGSFPSFEAARAAVPAGVRAGYDEADSALQLYSHQVCHWDYPAIFWIGDALQTGSRTVVDLGGHVGIKYYAFKRILDYPQDLAWTVCDVPSVVGAGERIAVERAAGDRLRFVTDPRGASGADVLMLSGSLQYLPDTMSSLLAPLKDRPRRVILNITATHGQRTLYTLNSIGAAVCPYRIQLQDEILSEIRLAGYRRRDVWRNDAKPIAVPFVDGGDGAYYFGCCFDRVDR